MLRLRFACLALLVGVAAAATVYPPLQREPILSESIPDQNPPVRLVKGVRIRFAPGQPTPLHRHPASVVGVVTEGSFLFQRQGSGVQTLKTGDSFFEPAGATIVQFANASRTAPAVIDAFYLTDSADRPVIELLDEKK